MPDPEVDDTRIAAVCRVLLEHRVEFVVIGGVAARRQDSGYATVDIDICPSLVEENLEAGQPLIAVRDSISLPGTRVSHERVTHAPPRCS